MIFTGTSIAYSEAAPGVIDWQVNTNGSNLFTTLALLKQNADLSGYDASMWTIKDTSIVFGHNTVLTVA